MTCPHGTMCDSGDCKICGHMRRELPYSETADDVTKIDDEFLQWVDEVTGNDAHTQD